MKAISLFASAFLLIIIAFPVKAQPGSLDATFGNEGIVTAPLTSLSEQAYKVLVQPDGKILLCGMQEEAYISDFVVARYNPGGTLDNNFGNGGIAVIDGGIDSDSECARAMALQDDGKILLGGSIYNQFSTVDDFALIRLNSDGSPDVSFGTGGVVITDIDEGWDNAYGIALQDDGKILLGGEGYTNNKRNVCVIRYNTDGLLDATFGSGGIALHSIGTEGDKTKAIVLQDNGKILLCGYFSDGSDDQTFVSRFNSDGTVDNTFGNNGTATLDIGGNEDRFWTMCILDDGKILAGGYTRTPANDNDYLLVRYLTDGTLDNNFGSNGIMMHNFGSNDIMIEMVVQPDGKILSAGGAFSFELIRFLENGSLDTDFGSNGIVNTSIGTSCFAQSICMQNDGKIIVAGHSKDGTDEYDFSLARYHSEEGGFLEEQPAIFDHIKVFPNPVLTGNNITLEYTLHAVKEVSIELLSIDGKFLEVIGEKQYRKTGLHKESFILLHDLSAGIYLLRLSSAQGSAVIRLEIN